MRIYISVDMEGIAGIVTGKQVSKGKAYDMGIKLMVGEANAAVDGAFAAGAQTVVVNDSHGGMTNMAPADLDQRALLVSGPSKPNAMMEGIDDSFDAALFVGYHSRALTTGVLSHTFWGSVVSELKINGSAVGETALNAGIAGTFGVPVVLVTGDCEVTAEAAALISGVQTVTVKYPVSTFAATNLSPEVARKKIREGAIAALGKLSSVVPLRYSEPVTFELTFTKLPMADACEMIPGVRRTGPATVSYTGSYMEVFHCFIVMTTVGGAAMP